MSDVAARREMLRYVGHAINDALDCVRVRDVSECDRYDLTTSKIVAVQTGAEPMGVLVYSYLGVEIDDDEAIELAEDYLAEIGWCKSFEGREVAVY